MKSTNKVKYDKDNIYLVHLPILFEILPYRAMVIYPFLLHKEKPIEPVLLNHERIHFYQIEKDGYLYFYARYLYEYLQNRLKGMPHWNAYFNISYEIEAYTNDTNLEYLNDRQVTRRPFLKTALFLTYITIVVFFSIVIAYYTPIGW
jgi:hypothetical protein